MSKQQSVRPGYEYLIVYQLGCVIQILTELFTERWIKSYRRRSQMDEASRSVPQNIAEGFTQPSLKGYIKLAGVAYGSNEELTKDYVHFLKKRGLDILPLESQKVKRWRKFRVKWKDRYTLNTPKLPKEPKHSANMLLTFCNMEGYLLQKHVESLKLKHKKEGGLTEKLYKERKKYRGY